MSGILVRVISRRRWNSVGQNWSRVSAFAQRHAHRRPGLREQLLRSSIRRAETSSISHNQQFYHTTIARINREHVARVDRRAIRHSSPSGGRLGLRLTALYRLRCSQVAAQAGHVDRAGDENGDDKHLVHRRLQKSLQESLEEARTKHELSPGRESQGLFFPGFISRLRMAARFSGPRAARGHLRMRRNCRMG